jgi:hypothetical protein
MNLGAAARLLATDGRMDRHVSGAFLHCPLGAAPNSGKAGDDPASMQSPIGRRFAYWLTEPVCCNRVAAASPATVLPLWKTAAFATGAIVARLRAKNAARTRYFIELSISCRAQCPALMAANMDLCAVDDNRGF